MFGFTEQQKEELRQIIREELEALLTTKAEDVPRDIIGTEITVTMPAKQPRRYYDENK